MFISCEVSDQSSYKGPHLNDRHVQMIAQQDFELVRVWDSLVYEDDCEDELSLSLTAQGTLDENQTRQALNLGSNI